MSHFHFDLIGLKIGDIINFKPNGTEFRVSSGNGTPENGGTLIGNEKRLGEGLFSIKLATHRMLGADFNDNIDILELWDYGVKTLREMYNEILNH